MNCVWLHAFLAYERRQTIPPAKNFTRHTHTHCFFLMGSVTAATLFLISSAARGSSGVSHPNESPTPPPTPLSLSLSGLLHQCHPSLLIFSLLSPCLSLSLINVKLSNNKASILPLPASLVPCICHCDPPPPPTQRPPSSFHMAAFGAENAGSETAKHERLFSERKRGKEKKRRRRRHFSHFCLFFFVELGGRKGCPGRLHNSWETREKRGC